MFQEPESMRQVHRIREQLYEEEKPLSPAARVAKTHREAEAILKQWGFDLKRIPPPSRILSR